MTEKEMKDLLWQESFIAKFFDEVQLRKAKFKRAREAFACPTCGAAVNKECGYVVFEAHFGEDLPEGWVHDSRWTLVKEADAKKEAAEKKALDAML